MTDRELLDKLFCAALAAVDPLLALPPHLLQVKELFTAGGYNRLVVAGFGKAAVSMALTTEESLGAAISSGLVIVPHDARLPMAPGRIEVVTGGHPDPDDDSVAATRRIIGIVSSLDHKALLLLLVSGGGSALLAAPAEGISLQEKLATARLLMEAGADIVQLNTVRKHLSKVKGGQLAALAHPARVMTLAISDVPGDRPDTIASGPAYPDATTFADALGIVTGLGIAAQVPKAVMKRLENGAAGALAETPKPGDKIFSSVTTLIAARNRDAVAAAARSARQSGARAEVIDGIVSGEARQAGARLAEMAIGGRRKLAPGERLCLVAGGETTVRVVGKGKGGRNQELALSFAMAIAGEPGITLLAAGTDGIDGPTDAAGAIVDGNTAALAEAAGFDPGRFLANNDAYPLLDACGALVKTGPTGTNVMDLQIVMLSG